MKFTSPILCAALSMPLASAFVPSASYPASQSPPSTFSSRLHAAAASEASSTSDSAVNNVVLSPSEGPEKFDSYAIGTPRVHRYLRDDGSDDAEYVMWYHGRCQDLNHPDKNLPPLSTGRIGRATSRNGLVWTKCEIGSGSETTGPPGVSLGLNEESWWNFDTAHVGLGQVMLPMSTPAVLAEGGVYLMYYMGGTHEETFVGSYLEDPGAVPDDATIKGMNLRVGVAMSQDGLTWGRVEGDDPTGAIMAPYDKSDPNQRWMSAEAGYRDDDNSLLELEEELYVGWPEVVVHHIDGDDAANVLSVNSFANTAKGASDKTPPAFYMYYSTMLKDCKTKAIGCAVSQDGFRWYKRGTCLRPDEDGMDAGGCARCTVIRNANFNEEKGIWENAPGWTMYYEGVNPEDGKHRVMAAESADGRNWEKLGVVLDVGVEEEGGWDFNGVGSPHMLRLDDGSVRMYYTGQGKDGHTSIGIAKADGADGARAKFTREQAQFSFA